VRGRAASRVGGGGSRDASKESVKRVSISAMSRPVSLPVRLELRHSRVWVHNWLDEDRRHIAYINEIHEQPTYAPEQISIAPGTLGQLFELAINTHSIEPWESPAWADPKAPIGQEDGGLTAETQPRSYGGEELLPDGGEGGGESESDDPEAEWRAEQRRQDRVDRMNRRLLEGEQW